MFSDCSTRGRTAPGRLRALDAFLMRAESPLLSRSAGPWADAAFVDVGFGDSPITTLEAAKQLRAVNPDLLVLGVERDAQRVRAAQAHGDQRTQFRRGGFALPLLAGESARLVRVMNVLREYPEADVEPARALLAQPLLEGGLLVEGSAERDGSVLCAHLLRGRGPELLREGLLFHTDFSRGFAPWLFRDWLPRDFRRRVRPGEAIHLLLQAWTEAWEQSRADRTPSQAFSQSLRVLAGTLSGVSIEPWLLHSGYFLWGPEGGVPR